MKTARGTDIDWLRNRGPRRNPLAVRSEHENINNVPYLDSLGIKLQTLLLVREELLNILALIALELDHLSHLSVDDDGAIASYHELLVIAFDSCEQRATYRTSS